MFKVNVGHIGFVWQVGIGLTVNLGGPSRSFCITAKQALFLHNCIPTHTVLQNCICTHMFCIFQFLVYFTTYCPFLMHLYFYEIYLLHPTIYFLNNCIIRIVFSSHEINTSWILQLHEMVIIFEHSLLLNRTLSSHIPHMFPTLSSA